MQINEFYEKAGGNYEEVKSRLLTDERICKYLRKFPLMDDFANLQQAVAAENWADAFRFSHNLKGMCLNLGLLAFYEPSNTLCENLRPGTPIEDPVPMTKAVEDKYTETIALINEFLGE